MRYIIISVILLSLTWYILGIIPIEHIMNVLMVVIFVICVYIMSDGLRELNRG